MIDFFCSPPFTLSLHPCPPFLSLRDIREYANGSVCLECDSQCELADGDTLTCHGPVSLLTQIAVNKHEALYYVSFLSTLLRKLLVCSERNRFHYQIKVHGGFFPPLEGELSQCDNETKHVAKEKVLCISHPCLSVQRQLLHLLAWPLEVHMKVWANDLV